MSETKLTRLIYDYTPVVFQNIMASVYGWQKNRYRYASSSANKWFDFYKTSAGWTESVLREYQLAQTLETIRYAYKHVPFYKKRFDSCQIKLEDIRTFEDMAHLPYLTKDDIRTSSTLMISDEYKQDKLFSSTTSGSTGMPMTLYSDREAAARSYNYHWAQCRPGLVKGEDRYANFTGLEIVKPSQAKPPFWRMNYASKQRLYSVFHMSDKNMVFYLEDLIRFKPDWLYGYPSALNTLADFILRTEKTFPCPPKAVVTSSEQCLPEYRNNIEKAFQTRLWDEYGQGEMAGLAFECQCGKLHEKIDYSLMEFIPVSEEDGFQVCELVCTSFVNKACPLIRYRVGDLALIDPRAKCTLGKPGRVIERIYGRTAQYIIAADGSRITNISVMAKECRNLKAVQAEQECVGEIKLKVVPLPEYNLQDDEPILVKQFRKKLGDESRMSIKIEYVKEIALTKRGKFISIVNKIDKGALS